MSLKTQLNSEQLKAVTAHQKNILVLAGAGSGKTSVLTKRMAWLCQEKKYSPLNILAVTFTNKAAKEMRSRVESLLGYSTFGMWIGTFHGIAHRLLRRHAEEINLTRKFKIIDQDDQYQLLKKIIRSQNLDDKLFPPRVIQGFINARKDEGIRSDTLSAAESHHDPIHIKIYQAYELQMKANQTLDFADLLLYTYELFNKNDVIREHYQQRFQAILVDEFQDTNKIQYGWLKLLMSSNNSIMAVGDDDQSIYAWRGAKVENIFQFKDDYAPVETIKLEQNYRSTQNILNAANGLIENNETRLGKNLWSDGNKGDKVALYEAINERDEADFVIMKIQEQINKGVSADNFAILYRSNAQSRVFEEALLLEKIPYRIYGGVRFFDRAEIKDLLSYLRLIIGPDDNLAFERIINVPTRGIGLRTVDKIRENALLHNLSLWASAKMMLKNKTLTGKAQKSVSIFIELLEKMEKNIENLTLSEQVRIVLEQSELLEFYSNDKREKSQQKIENLKELVSAANSFTPPVEAVAEEEMLQEFLSFAVLESGERQADENTPSVQLMTLHSAKGLEFPYVYLVGLEEELSPSSRSCYPEDKLEEERRLCYVGMTRAKEYLTLSYAKMRYFYGNLSAQIKSRFIKEIPEQFIQNVRIENNKTHNFGFGISPDIFLKNQKTNNKSLEQIVDASVKYKQGDIVEHKKFGMGVFIKQEDSGEDARLYIDFKGGPGIKVLVAKFAKLSKIS